MEGIFEVYLAGRIAGLNFDDATRERAEITERLEKIGVKSRNPMRGKSWLAAKIKDQPITIDTYRKQLSVQEIIVRDLHDIDRVNVVLVLTGDSPSWGTTGEFWYATWIAHKPTLVISKNNVGGWLEYYATKIVPDVEAAIEVLEDWKKYWDDGECVYEVIKDDKSRIN